MLKGGRLSSQRKAFRRKSCYSLWPPFWLSGVDTIHWLASIGSTFYLTDNSREQYRMALIQLNWRLVMLLVLSSSSFSSLPIYLSHLFVLAIRPNHPFWLLVQAIEAMQRESFVLKFCKLCKNDFHVTVSYMWDHTATFRRAFLQSAIRIR